MKFKRISIRTTPSGQEIFLQTYFFEGSDKEAKSAYLQASVHGAEIQGNAVIFYLIEYFKKNPPRGSVTLVPCANPVGMDRKTGEATSGRFDPTTGDNWNRAYFMPVIQKEEDREDPAQLCAETLPSGISRADLKKRMTRAIREKKENSFRFSEMLALTLQEMASHADLVLDLHTANSSQPYLYSSESTLNDALYFGLPTIISIPSKFGGAMDEAIFTPWTLLHHKYEWPAHSIPQAYTLELGNEEALSFFAGEKQAKGIIEFLKHHGVVSGKARKPSSAVVGMLKNYKTVYAKRGGLYEFIVPFGKPVQKGKVLAYCLHFNATGGVREPVISESKFYPLLHHTSGAVNEGDELTKGFVEWSTLKPRHF